MVAFDIVRFLAGDNSKVKLHLINVELRGFSRTGFELYEVFAYGGEAVSPPFDYVFAVFLLAEKDFGGGDFVNIFGTLYYPPNQGFAFEGVVIGRKYSAVDEGGKVIEFAIICGYCMD